MKKFLAENMSKENESRRRSPSVIARLMGLDGLPPQQPGNKQQKSCSLYNQQSSRKNSKDEQEFKDVFEVLDTRKSIRNSKHTEAEMAFIRQKFIDVKRLSTDEKLQDSKEFDDALEVLDSNKDLLLKFLQQPDSLFTKHLHDLQNGLPEPHCSRISTVKSSRALRSENSSLAQRTERESRRKNHSNKSPHNRQADTLNHSSAVIVPPKLSKIRVEENDHQALQPMRIVVLKPNLEKSQNATRISSSPRSSHYLPSDCRKHTELLDIKTKEADNWGKKKVYGDLETLRPDSSRESREIAREITRKMRNALPHSSMDFPTSKFRGYAGDESSSDISGSESATDSDVTKVTLKEDFNRNNRRRSSYIRSSESPVSREARKRLSERWKMAHRSQEVRGVSKGSTLGEMLAIPVVEVRRPNFRGSIEEECSHKFGNDDGRSSGVEPLGISSKDGWRDECLGSLSRSRSLPASADFQNPRTNLRQDNFCSGIHVSSKDCRTHNTSKPIKGKFSPREVSLSMKSSSSMKKSQTLSRNDNEESSKPDYVDLPDCLLTYSMNDNEQSEETPIVPVASAGSVTERISFHENEMDVNNQDATVSSEPCDQELLASSSPNGNFSAGERGALAFEGIHDGKQEGSPLHSPETQMESRDHPSSKEADQPSPVSVFKAPFTDDPSSSSECFESLSADIHGLRMQLQLLKSESEPYAAEGSMLVSSDDDADDVSSRFVDGKGASRAEENLESSYISNVLIDSGINGTDPETFKATWYSLDCPINSSVFEELEKKYSILTSWSRAERKLLYDRINLKLLEIYNQSTNQLPWVKKTAGRIHPMWNDQGLEDSLRKMLEVEDKKAKKDVAYCVLGSESQWLDLGDDIDIIGREIELLLIDELVAEVAAR